MHLNYCRHSHINTGASSHTHAHTLSLTPTHTEPSVTRASGCSAPALMEGLTSAMLSYFHPPQIFRQQEEKRVREKWWDQEHEILLFLCNPLIHFILLPNLQGPGTTYSVMRKWVEEGSEACWENSLQHSLQLSGETVKMQSFWVITIPSCDYSLTCHCTVGGRPGFIFVVQGNVTIGNILCTSITEEIGDIKQRQQNTSLKQVLTIAILSISLNCLLQVGNENRITLNVCYNCLMHRLVTFWFNFEVLYLPH